MLDTHAVLWFMLSDQRLSNTAADIIVNAANECLISPASYWETAIKISIGKYKTTEDFGSLWQDVLDRFVVIHIEPRHTGRLIFLPFHHKDPFDRLIAAQALVEQIPILSCGDGVFDAYGVERLW